MATQAEKAQQFRALHAGPRPFLLPNAWDVATARIFEDAGFPAIATTSAAIMVAHGFPDGEEMPRKAYLATVARIAGAVGVPVSADLVAGFGRGPKEVARTALAAIDAGAIGLNLEDHDGAKGGLHPLRRQAAKIAAIRTAAEARGVPIVINARTDALRHGEGDEPARLREAIRRGRAYREAGADCVYPMGLVHPERIREFVEGTPGPVNVMVRPGLPSLDELEHLGVRRVSFGPAGAYASLAFLRRAAIAARDGVGWNDLTEGALTFEELNRLASPRGPPPAPGST